jgi:hypothetical protein
MGIRISVEIFSDVVFSPFFFPSRLGSLIRFVNQSRKPLGDVLAKFKNGVPTCKISREYPWCPSFEFWKTGNYHTIRLI